MAKRSRIIKVAGLSLAGFCAVSLVADKVSVGAEVAQVAGYCGAFLGALVGRGRPRRHRRPAGLNNAPVPEASESDVVPVDHG